MRFIDSRISPLARRDRLHDLTLRSVRPQFVGLSRVGSSPRDGAPTYGGEFVAGSHEKSHEKAAISSITRYGSELEK